VQLNKGANGINAHDFEPIAKSGFVVVAAMGLHGEALHGFDWRDGLAESAWLDHSQEGINDLNQARIWVLFVGARAVWIARPIGAFVVLTGNGYAKWVKSFDAFQNINAAHGDLFNHVEFDAG